MREPSAMASNEVMMPMTTGTKMPLILSASRPMGALVAVASSTSRTIWARVVSSPTRSARMTRWPEVLMVAPVTRSPACFSTGMLSPVSALWSMAGGVSSTATLLAGQIFGIPVSGTMAHSWVMYHDDEYTAFKRFAELYPDNSVLLVDTYDVFKSGIPNAIRVAREVLIPRGKRLKGIRLDSGDLAYLSKAARRMLDEAGLTDCKIVASNSLDEFTIRSILEQGGCIDAFGVGERLITARSDPVFGAVYKLVAVNKGKACYPKIKVSETFEKITNPGKKQVWRVYDGQGHAVSDLITMAEETPDFSGEYPYVNPQRPWRTFVYSGCTARRMHELVMEDGRRVRPSPPLEEIRAYVKRQLETEIWPEEQRFENPHKHYLDMSPAYYRMKMELLSRAQNGTL